MAPTLFITSVLAAVENRFQSAEEEADESSDLPSTEEPESEDHPDSTESHASMFQCPDCELVFVAADEHTCSNCETDAVEVPSTLSEAR
jgi:hypothetical protein